MQIYKTICLLGGLFFSLGSVSVIAMEASGNPRSTHADDSALLAGVLTNVQESSKGLHSLVREVSDETGEHIETPAPVTSSDSSEILKNEIRKWRDHYLQNPQVRDDFLCTVSGCGKFSSRRSAIQHLLTQHHWYSLNQVIKAFRTGKEGKHERPDPASCIEQEDDLDGKKSFDLDDQVFPEGPLSSSIPSGIVPSNLAEADAGPIDSFDSSEILKNEIRKWRDHYLKNPQIRDDFLCMHPECGEFSSRQSVILHLLTRHHWYSLNQVRKALSTGRKVGKYRKKNERPDPASCIEQEDDLDGKKSFDLDGQVLPEGLLSSSIPSGIVPSNLAEADAGQIDSFDSSEILKNEIRKWRDFYLQNPQILDSFLCMHPECGEFLSRRSVINHLLTQHHCYSSKQVREAFSSGRQRGKYRKKNERPDPASCIEQEDDLDGEKSFDLDGQVFPEGPLISSISSGVVPSNLTGADAGQIDSFDSSEILKNEIRKWRDLYLQNPQIRDSFLCMDPECGEFASRQSVIKHLLTQHHGYSSNQVREAFSTRRKVGKHRKHEGPDLASCDDLSLIEQGDDLDGQNLLI